MIVKAFSSEYFKELKNLRKRNIIFFNGVFDIVHIGHLKLINSIKILSNNYFNSPVEIVCGLNSDLSVSKINKSHPLINNEMDRAQFIKCLGIDNVFIFDETTPTALIMNLVPDIIVKGSDYKDKPFHEKDYIYKTNTKLEYVDLEIDKSTTNIYNKIYNIAKEDIRRKLDET